MGLPVKLSDEIVRQARAEAKATDRSITAQIEHWAKLGRSLETALRHEHVLALKRAKGNLKIAFPDTPTRKSIEAVLRRVAQDIDRKNFGRALAESRTVYQSDPRGSGAIERIEPDGTRTLGRLKNRTFIANPASSKRRRR